MKPPACRCCRTWLVLMLPARRSGGTRGHGAGCTSACTVWRVGTRLWRAAAVLTGVFIKHAWSVYRLRDGKAAERAPKQLFGYSIIYLFAMFGAMLVDRAAYFLWQFV
jgi:heme O synthase-like polyprenyltransferase